MSGDLQSYQDILDVLDALPVIIREKRRRDGLSLREAARTSGVQFSTMSRAEHGQGIQLKSARLLLIWAAGLTKETT